MGIYLVSLDDTPKLEGSEGRDYSSGLFGVGIMSSLPVP
jgi:hypothetical protein